MKKYTLEICVDSVKSAINAERGKATRLELCSNLIIGGTTPTKSLFEEVKKNVNIPINVLIRPRFGDFLYSDYEVNIIKNEIKVGENDEIVKNYKIGGFTLEYAVKDKNEEKAKILIDLNSVNNFSGNTAYKSIIYRKNMFENMGYEYKLLDMASYI